MMVLEDFTIADLSDEAIQGYRNYHAAVRPGHVWEKLPKEEYLEKIGAVGRLKGESELRPTAAGLLMFGEEYRIVRYFPEYFLDYREVLDASIRWTDRIQSSSGDWSGNLFDFFFRVYNKLTRDFEKPFALDGAARVDDTPVHKAVREALANCIVNTDFYLPRGIVILKEQDKVVLQNPGSIRTGKEQMLRGGISDPRNKAIMKMLNLIAIGERAGSGVPDIYSVWAGKGWKDPSQTITPKHQDDALNDALEKLLNEIKGNPRITQQELSRNLALSRATIQRMIKMLIAEGIIERKGGKRFGYWEIKNRQIVE